MFWVISPTFEMQDSENTFFRNGSSLVQDYNYKQEFLKEISE